MKRDVSLLKCYARYVVFLNDRAEKIRFVDNQETAIANVIVFLGPAVFCGVFLEEAILLEVGFSRGRPYTQCERTYSKDGGIGKGRKRLSSRDRHRARELSEEERSTVFAFLETLFEELTLETRSRWTEKSRQEPWFVMTDAGPKPFNKGMYFTVDQRDTWLYEKILQQDVVFRSKRYLKGNAQHISYWLRRFRLSSYPEGQLKKFLGARKVASLLKNMRQENQYLSAVLNLLPKKKVHLVRQIAEVFRIKLPEDYSRVNFQQQTPPAFSKGAVRVVRTCFSGNGSHGRHAQGCAVFEFFFTKSVWEGSHGSHQRSF